MTCVIVLVGDVCDVGDMMVMLVTCVILVMCVQVRATLETLTAQDWVREKCKQHVSCLLEPEYLGDTTLTPTQVFIGQQSEPT